MAKAKEYLEYSTERHSKSRPANKLSQKDGLPSPTCSKTKLLHGQVKGRLLFTSCTNASNQSKQDYKRTTLLSRK